MQRGRIDTDVVVLEVPNPGTDCFGAEVAPVVGDFEQLGDDGSWIIRMLLLEQLTSRWTVSRASEGKAS